MGNFNKYNDRSLSQLLAESAAILAEEEFPPGGAATEPPPAAGGELPPDEGELEAGGPPGEEGEGEEEGAEDTPEGIINQMSDLLDKLRAQVAPGSEEGEEGEENADMTSSELPGKDEGDISAPAPTPPVESRRRSAAPAKKVAPAKKPAPTTAKRAVRS